MAIKVFSKSLKSFKEIKSYISCIYDKVIYFVKFKVCAVCPRSFDLIYLVSKLLYEMDQDFLAYFREIY